MTAGGDGGRQRGLRFSCWIRTPADTSLLADAIHVSTHHRFERVCGGYASAGYDYLVIGFRSQPRCWRGANNLALV